MKLKILIFICLITLQPLLALAIQDQSPEPMPDVLIPFDTEKSPEYIFVVEKVSQTFMVYEYNGKPRQILKFKCSTGKSSGRKERSGDKKTPEGVYFFTKIHEDKELAPIYGIRAFPTDYPNLMDRMAGRTGSAIWLHGTNKVLKDQDSNGCVALENKNLKKVGKYITLNHTPIIIADKLDYDLFETKTELKNDLTRMVSGWTAALEGGPYHDYMSFYDAEYLPNISWWTDWNQTRKTLGSEVHPLSVNADKIMVFRHKNTYVTIFNLFINLGGRKTPVGTKKFFLTYKNKEFKIIGENYQTFPGINTHKKNENPFVAAFKNLAIPARPSDLPEESIKEAVNLSADEAEIEALLDGWLKAWSSKNIKTYGTYYARDFRSQGMNKKAWLKHKKRLNKKYKYIRVSKKNLTARPNKKQLNVNFIQHYESNAFKAVGNKQLVLKQENGQWKIFRETWKKM